MSETNLSLYRIETELLELLQFREDTALDQTITPQERDETLKVTDQRIAEYVSQRVPKVDNIAGMLREFDRRADLEDEEIARLQARKRKWQAWHDRLEECTIRAMQVSGKKEIYGAHNTLKLRKNPASVDVMQSDLLPASYQRVKVTINYELWKRLCTQEPALLQLAECGQPEPIKRVIAEDLKRGDGVPGCRLVDDKVRLVIE